MKKILVPIDGSSASVKAAEEALRLAREFNSELTFLTVVEEKNRIQYNYLLNNLSQEYFDMINDLTSLEKEYAASILDTIIDMVNGDGVQISEKIDVGDVIGKILETARKDDYDLIVMGHRGLNPIQRLFLGSVAKKIVEYAPCSVLIVKK